MLLPKLKQKRHLITLKRARGMVFGCQEQRKREEERKEKNK